MKLQRLFIFLFTLAILLRCAGGPTAPPSGSGSEVSGGTTRTREVRVIFTANRQGESDACGCQLNQLGGLERLANFVFKKRVDESSKNLIMVDAGDTFFSSPQINPRREVESLAKAKGIAKSFRVIGVEAMVPGERDLALGVPVLRELETLSGVKLVAANLNDESGKPIFPSSEVFNKDGLKIGVFGVLGEDGFQALKGFQITPWKNAAEEEVKKLREAGAEFVIALSHLGLNLDRELAAIPGIDFVAGSHSQDVTSRPVVVEGTVIGQPHPQGHQVGYAKMVTSSKQLKEFSVVDLNKDYDGKNQVSELLAALVAEIGSTAATMDPQYRGSASRPYVAHPTTCRSCHKAQYDFWEKTKHASAYMVLFSKNQHFNPECISCHTLGFEQPGGFAKIASPVDVKEPVSKGKKKTIFIESFMSKVFGPELKKGALDSRLEPARHKKLHRNYTAELKKLEAAGKVQKWFVGVQCEHCHGNRNGHPIAGADTLKKVSENTCRQCHRAPNAPDFDPASVKQVACPLMAKQ